MHSVYLIHTLHITILTYLYIYLLPIFTKLTYIIPYIPLCMHTLYVHTYTIHAHRTPTIHTRTIYAYIHYTYIHILTYIPPTIHTTGLASSRPKHPISARPPRKPSAQYRNSF